MEKLRAFWEGLSKPAKIVVGALVLFLVLGLFSSAFGQTSNCGPRDAIIAFLTDKYGESRQAIGIAGNGWVFEVFASNETGTWSVTITQPSGLMCIKASGDSFENLSEVVEPAGLRL